MFLELILDHGVITLVVVSIWRLILSLMSLLFMDIIMCGKLISLLLFAHRALNKLLHLDNASISLAAMLGEVCGTCWLHYLWVCVILLLLIKHFLVFDDVHFVYLVLIHISLNCCTVANSSGPSKAGHSSWSFLMILLMIVDYFIGVISVSSWRLEYLW